MYVSLVEERERERVGPISCLAAFDNDEKSTTVHDSAQLDNQLLTHLFILYCLVGSGGGTLVVITGVRVSFHLTLETLDLSIGYIN